MEENSPKSPIDSSENEQHVEVEVTESNGMLPLDEEVTEESVDENEAINVADVQESNLSPELTQQVLDSAITNFKEANPDKTWEEATQEERYKFIEQARKG